MHLDMPSESFLIMGTMKVLVVSAFLFWTSVAAITSLSDTCERVARHGYSCQKYTTQTEDGYILSVFRMQRSQLPNNEMESNKSAVFLMHGLLCSSDTWVLSGPNDGLIYLLADAGYDVWLGNARGTEYSQKHTYLSALLPNYWDFSWHEIGKYDIPAMVDFVISTTGQAAVHYVGHSQGCTSFMVMLSTRPSYSVKFKSCHLLAPPVFMENMPSPGAAALAPLLGSPTLLAALLGTSKFVPGDDLLRLIAPEICKYETTEPWCNNVVLLAAGGPSPYTNFSTFEEFFQTHPRDSSVRQIIHYLQERKSGKFSPYDFGLLLNYVKYNAPYPPSYVLNNVNTTHPLDLYFSDNDDDVSVIDVYRLKSILGDRVSLHHIKYPEFNHVDFVIASNIKEVINDCVLDKINQNENRPFNGNLCTAFTD